MANRPSTRTVAEPLDACSYAIGAAVNCTNPGFSPVTMAHPLGLPSTVAIDASLGDHWNPAFVTGCVSPVAPTLNANAYIESRSPCPRMPRDCRESESRTTTWMSLALSVGTEQEASTTTHAAPSPRARTGRPMIERSAAIEGINIQDNGFRRQRYYSRPRRLSSRYLSTTASAARAGGTSSTTTPAR